MLRISVTNDANATRFKLEGKLAHEWVGEAAKAWAALTNLHGIGEVIVDLRDVSFVDDAGQRLLLAMHRWGGKLCGSGLMMSALIGEIQGVGDRSDKPRPDAGSQQVHNDRAEVKR